MKKEDVIMFKRKFDAYYPQHDSREVKVTDKVAPDLEFEANDGISMFRSWTAYYDEVVNWLHTNDESWCELGKRVLFNNREHVSTHEVLSRTRLQKEVDLLWANKLLATPGVRETLGKNRLKQCQSEGIYSGMLLAKSISDVVCAYDPARMLEVEGSEARLKEVDALVSLKDALNELDMISLQYQCFSEFRQMDPAREKLLLERILINYISRAEGTGPGEAMRTNYHVWKRHDKSRDGLFALIEQQSEDDRRNGFHLPAHLGGEDENPRGSGPLDSSTRTARIPLAPKNRKPGRGKEGTKEEKVMELSRPRGICHQFRDTRKCTRGDRCHFEHKPGTVPCTNAAYLDTGCCSDHLACPCVHKFDESKHGPKHQAIQKMLQGVREGKYHTKPGDHMYWLQEHSMPYNEEGEEKNKGG